MDLNSVPDPDFDIIPSSKVSPEDVVHLYSMGQPMGYILDYEDGVTGYVVHPEESIIHFSLGGLLGDYSITTR